MFRTNSKRRPNKSMRKSRKHRKGGDDVSGGLKRRKSRKHNRKGGGSGVMYTPNEEKYIVSKFSSDIDDLRAAQNEVSKDELARMNRILQDKMDKHIIDLRILRDQQNKARQLNITNVRPLQAVQALPATPKPWWKIF
jgi:hypothetical protein